MLFQACQVHYPKIDMGDGNGRFFLITMYYIYLSIYLSISEHRQNAHNDGNRAQPLKGLLQTLFLAIRKCTGFTTNVI